jgi:16S rRNA processing protein RimM
VEVLTDRPEDRFARGARVFREGSDDELTIVSAEAIPDGPGWRLRFAELPDRTSAERLRGAYLEAIAGPAEVLPRGSYYWHQVIGATIRDLQDRAIGVVHDVYRVGEAEVFVVRGEPYGEFDLPAVRAFIRIFAPMRGEIVVDSQALGLETPRSGAAAQGSETPRAPRTPRKRSVRRRATGAVVAEPGGADPPVEPPIDEAASR